jgi:hypothetical protein
MIPAVALIRSSISAIRTLTSATAFRGDFVHIGPSSSIIASARRHNLSPNDGGFVRPKRTTRAAPQFRPASQLRPANSTKLSHDFALVVFCDLIAHAKIQAASKQSPTSPNFQTAP